jgi:hypothetical protein
VEFVAPDEQAFADLDSTWQPDPSRDRAAFGAAAPRGRTRTGVTAVVAVAILAIGTVAAVRVTRLNDRDRSPSAVDLDPRIPIHERETSYDDGDGGRPGDGRDADSVRTGRPATPPLFDARARDAAEDDPWVIDVPRDAVAIGATFVATAHEEPAGWFELRAAPRSDRTTGHWRSIQVVPGPGPAPPADATVTTVADRTVSEWWSRDRVAQLQFTVDGDGGPSTVRITAFGWSRDDLLVLAAALEVVDGRPVADLPAGTGRDGEELFVSRPTSNLGLEYEFLGDAVASSVTWRTDEGAMVAVVVASDDPTTASIGRFVLTRAAATPRSGPDVSVPVGEVDAVVGRFPGLDDQNLVRWTTGDRTIAVLGDLTVAELSDLVPSARPATGTEWTTILLELAPDPGPTIDEPEMEAGGRDGSSTDEVDAE